MRDIIDIVNEAQARSATAEQIAAFLKRALSTEFEIISTASYPDGSATVGVRTAAGETLEVSVTKARKPGEALRPAA